MAELVISIGDGGIIQHINHEDIIDYQDEEITIRRASHVEPVEPGMNLTGRWYVDLSPVGGPLEDGFQTRKEALNFEVAYINEKLRKGDM